MCLDYAGIPVNVLSGIIGEPTPRTWASPAGIRDRRT